MKDERKTKKELIAVGRELIRVRQFRDALSHRHFYCSFTITVKDDPWFTNGYPQEVGESQVYRGGVCDGEARSSAYTIFWVNVNDDWIDAPGIVEYSNLNPTRGALIYVPYYLPHSHPRFSWDDGMYFHELKKILARINPEFDDKPPSSAWMRRGLLRLCDEVC